MGLAKLLPIQGWVFLGILVGGAYFGYTTFTSFADRQRMPIGMPAASPAKTPDNDISIVRALLTKAEDRKSLETLELAMAVAVPSDLPALKALAAAMRLSVQTDCVLVVGKTAIGELELLSRNAGLVRPAVRCASADRTGELVTIQGLAPSPPWISLEDAQKLPPINGKNWVEIGSKPAGALTPTWIVKTH